MFYIFLIFIFVLKIYNKAELKIIKIIFFIFLFPFIFGCEKSVVNENISDHSNDKTINPHPYPYPVVTGKFNVLTYNIAGLLEPFSSSNPSLNTPFIGQRIRDYDIVQVQEDFNYHASLYANDNHLYRSATSGGMGFGDGLNTLSNFPFAEDLVRVKWNDCSGTDGNCLTPKGFTYTRIRLQEGVYIDLYNCHTNAGDVEAAYDARRKNVLQLVQYIQTNSIGNAVIITGDWNCRYTRNEDNIREVVTGLPATDPWVQLIRGGVEPTQGANAIVCDSSILTDYDCEVVDKIFYRGNKFIRLNALEYKLEDAIFRDSLGNMLSDHRPAFTEFFYGLPGNIRCSDQFGGNGGTNFNDVNLIPERPKVSSIGIRAGNRVDQVNIALTDGTTFIHGGTGGTANTLVLQEDEFINKVTLCSGTKDGTVRIFYIQFTTNLGNTISGGTQNSATVTYTAPNGFQVAGFHGKAGTELDKLGLIYMPL